VRKINEQQYPHLNIQIAPSSLTGRGRHISRYCDVPHKILLAAEAGEHFLN
jgi:hypothetical protein